MSTVEPQFRSRPLTATARDRRLWVKPKTIVERAVRSIELGFNTVVVGERGAGVTTLLIQLAAGLEDSGRGVTRAWAGEADDAAALLDVIANVLERLEEPTDSSDLRAAVARLQRAASERPGTLVVVDDVMGPPGHNVFGRMRDELWALELQWLIGTDTDQAPVLLTPPADSFFEATLHLEPLAMEQVDKLLRRRDPNGALGADLPAQIAERSDGNPARALALARRALLLDPEDRAAALLDDPVEDVRERLGEPAARLFSELLLRGRTGPSDDQLLARIGWSRPRAYQLFQDLEREGFIRGTNERSGGAGRPRRIYEVIEG